MRGIASEIGVDPVCQRGGQPRRLGRSAPCCPRASRSPASAGRPLLRCASERPQASVTIALHARASPSGSPRPGTAQSCRRSDSSSRTAVSNREQLCAPSVRARSRAIGVGSCQHLRLGDRALAPAHVRFDDALLPRDRDTDRRACPRPRRAPRRSWPRARTTTRPRDSRKPRPLGARPTVR